MIYVGRNQLQMRDISILKYIICIHFVGSHGGTGNGGGGGGARPLSPPPPPVAMPLHYFAKDNPSEIQSLVQNSVGVLRSNKVIVT